MIYNFPYFSEAATNKTVNQNQIFMYNRFCVVIKIKQAPKQVLRNFLFII